MDMGAVGAAACVSHRGMPAEAGQLSVCHDTVSCSRGPCPDRKILPVENGGDGVCRQIFFAKRHAREAVYSGHIQYTGTHDRDPAGKALLFLLLAQGISLYDGAVSDRRMAGIRV